MFCCALSYTNSEESFLIKEASVVGLCRGSIQSGEILVHTGHIPAVHTRFLELTSSHFSFLTRHVLIHDCVPILGFKCRA